jgi:hypothetical protein
MTEHPTSESRQHVVGSSRGCAVGTGGAAGSAAHMLDTVPPAPVPAALDKLPPAATAAVWSLLARAEPRHWEAASISAPSVANETRTTPVYVTTTPCSGASMASVDSCAEAKRKVPRTPHAYVPARHGSTGSGVEILGYSVAHDDGGTAHVEYTILSCTTVREYNLGAADVMSSNARIVQRRFREFEALREQLLPVARAAGVALARLPCKCASLAWSRAQLGARRQVGPHGVNARSRQRARTRRAAISLC